MSAEKKREEPPRLIEALSERLEAKLGPHARRTLDDALASEVDRLAEKVAAQVAQAVTEGAPISDLGWDEEPQTVQQPLEQVQRFRQLAAMSQPPRGSLTSAPVLGALRKTAVKQPWVEPEEKVSSGIRAAVGAPLSPAPLSLADMAETAPRDALTEEDADEALATPRDAEATAEHDALAAAGDAFTKEERPTVPARPPRVTEAPRVAQLPEAPPEEPRRRLGPFVAIAAVVLVLAVIVAVGLVFGAHGLAEPRQTSATPARAPGQAPRPQTPAAPEPAAPEPTAAERQVTEAAPEAAEPRPSESDESLSPRERSDRLVADALAAEQQGRWEVARVLYQEAFEVEPLNPHAVAGLARERLTAGDAEGALAHAERAVQLRRRRAAYRVLLGDARRMGGDVGGARRAYERALELDPEDRDARQRLGR